MGRWCVAVVNLGAFGLMSPSESAAKPNAEVVMSVEVQDGIDNRRKRANLKIDSGSIRGFCKKSDVAKNVRRRAGAIRACYERQLQRTPKLAGKVTARWTIGLDGRVMRASAKGLGSVSKCIAATLRRIRYQKPEGGVPCSMAFYLSLKPGNCSTFETGK